MEKGAYGVTRYRELMKSLVVCATHGTDVDVWRSREV